MAVDTMLHRAAPRVIAGFAVLSAAGLYLVDPNTTHVPLCPLHAATGLWCPLCGSTRAAYALLHGRLGIALHDNALFVAALPVLMLLWLRRALAGDTGRLIPAWLCWATVGIALGFSVLRNLPAGSWLAPPG